MSALVVVMICVVVAGAIAWLLLTRYQENKRFRTNCERVRRALERIQDDPQGTFCVVDEGSRAGRVWAITVLSADKLNFGYLTLVASGLEKMPSVKWGCGRAFYGPLLRRLIGDGFTGL